MPDTKILVVDDIEANVAFLSDILTHAGYQVLKAYKGEDALRLTREHQPILILLDIMMPMMSGLMVCRTLKDDASTRDIPVIFLSALNEAENILDGFAAGGVDYIAKPFKIKEVMMRISTHVTLQQQRKALQDSYQQISRLQAAMTTFLSQSTRDTIEESVFGDDNSPIPRPMHKTLTVMFTDIANFTTISETLDLDEVITDLTLYMALVSQIIHEHSGQIDKFLGDGVLAFFDDAADALDASCAIQRRLALFNQEQEARQCPRFDTRIGLATGKVLQAQIGFDNRRELTIIGDRVNTASRLQSRAPLNGILLDEATYRSIPAMRYSDNEMYILKGKQQTEVAYSLEFDLIQELALQA